MCHGRQMVGSVRYGSTGHSTMGRVVEQIFPGLIGVNRTNTPQNQALSSVLNIVYRRVKQTTPIFYLRTYLNIGLNIKSYLDVTIL
jgi:hypothetical protein